MNFNMLVKPEIILGQSKKILTETANLKNKMEEMQKLVDGLNTVWDAKSGQLFVDKYGKVKGNIEKHILHLNGICESINKVAEEYIASENENNKQVSDLTSNDLFS